MKPAIFFCVFILVAQSVLAQNANHETDVRLEMRNLFSGKEGQPFWFHANQLGQISDKYSEQGILNLSGEKRFVLDKNKSLKLGLNLSGRYMGNSSMKLLEYWGRYNFKHFYFHAGAKGEPEFANGLSLTNGNLYLSNNARPMPRIEFGTEALQLFDGDIGSKFSFDALYSEYFLLDERYISNANLHHKRLGINYQLSSSWALSFDLDHWVFWGGKFPDGKEIPGIEEYFRYILTISGGKGSIITEQQNASGNHTGQYQIQIKHSREDWNLNFYWQHLWEDGSGAKKFKNISDGLWGLSCFRNKRNQFIDRFVIEYINTKHQSGKIHEKANNDGTNEFIGGRDNYFNHYIYQSGFTSYNRMIGLPLLIPSINETGISKGFPSNRLWGIHSGVSGSIIENLSWKTLMTYSKHFGTYANPFPKSKDLFSFALDLKWNRNQKPLSYRMRFAVDRGNYLPKTLGLEFAINYRIIK